MDTDGLWQHGLGYLDTANYGLPPRTTLEAVRGAISDWETGRTTWEPWDESVGEARRLFGQLVGVPTETVAVGSTTSEQLGLIASSLPDDAVVVVSEEEFSSNLFPWLVQEERGLKVVLTPPGKLLEGIDSRTTLVAVSAVQSSTGEVAPLDDLVAACRHHGSLLVVDATQACGWLPLQAGRFDALVAHSYKWLCSPRGASFMAIRRELYEKVRPMAAGWYAASETHAAYYGPPLRLSPDARRLATSPAWFSYVGAAASLAAINRIGIGAIHRHDVSLANRLRAGLGLEASDSAIVSVELAEGAERLEAAGIRASVRAGRTRFSFHLYNSEEEVDRVLEALRS